MKSNCHRIIILTVLLASTACTTVANNQVSVSPSVTTLKADVYSILPFEALEGEYGGSSDRVEEGGTTLVEGLVRAHLVAIVPVVIDRQITSQILDEIDLQVSGKTIELNQRIGEQLGADAIITGRVTDFNASRVGISITATHVDTGATLWSGDVSARVGWVFLDVERAAARAVQRLMTSLESELSRVL